MVAPFQTLCTPLKGTCPSAACLQGAPVVSVLTLALHLLADMVPRTLCRREGHGAATVRRQKWTHLLRKTLKPYYDEYKERYEHRWCTNRGHALHVALA